MKITDLKLYYMPHRFLFLKIETDEGISGWGEPLVEGRAATLEAAVLEWKEYLIGQDPLLIEQHWQTMYRCAFYRGGPVMMSTIAGIDEALWDIKGKYLNQSVASLLGGPVRDKIKVYRSIHGDTPEALAADARRAVTEGYQLIKAAPTGATHFVDSYQKVTRVLDMIGAVREEIGDEADLAVDFHGRIHRPMAKPLVTGLNEYRLSFIEEPVLSENREALREIAQCSRMPIALGERLYSRWDFKAILTDGYVDIIQPDLSHAGGISECRRIAAMAEAFDVAFAPHCPLDAIAFAACIQVDAATPNAVFQEQSIGIHNPSGDNVRMNFMQEIAGFRYENGYVRLPERPGLGIEIDEELVAATDRHRHNWKNPIWETDDGTRIEW